MFELLKGVDKKTFPFASSALKKSRLPFCTKNCAPVKWKVIASANYSLQVFSETFSFAHSKMSPNKKLYEIFFFN